MAKKEKKLVTANMPAPQVLVTQAAADHQSRAEPCGGAAAPTAVGGREVTKWARRQRAG